MLLLNAYSRLRPELREDTRLVVAGSPPAPTFWDSVKAAKLNQRVEFIESPSNDALVRLYQNAAVFVLSSDEEGFGMVILEAMACGIPVVSTRSGGPDGIIADGEDGYLVELEDADAIADRVAGLLCNEALNTRIGAAARRKIVARYESGIAGQDLVAIYDELLARRRR
jgi:glycosyltransferase involved in cell wall biosynthesis